MTEKDILEYNKMCAEFLGLKNGWWISQQKPLTDDKKQWWNISGSTFLGTKVYYNKDLQFHQDWNWIMEVVEAIENLFDGDMLVEISDESCYMGYHKKYEMYTTMSTKKEAVVQGINKFLIWYYKNK